MDRPGVRQVPEGSGEQGKMKKTACKIICGPQRPSRLRNWWWWWWWWWWWCVYTIGIFFSLPPLPLLLFLRSFFFIFIFCRATATSVWPFCILPPRVCIPRRKQENWFDWVDCSYNLVTVDRSVGQGIGVIVFTVVTDGHISVCEYRKKLYLLSDLHVLSLFWVAQLFFFFLFFFCCVSSFSFFFL